MLIVAICQGVVGRQNSNCSNDCANARDPSEIYPVTHRRITSYLAVREVHIINFHFLGINFLLVPMMTSVRAEFLCSKGQPRPEA